MHGDGKAAQGAGRRFGEQATRLEMRIHRQVGRRRHHGNRHIHRHEPFHQFGLREARDGTRDRIDNAYRIARLCKFLQGEGVLVVCSTMSLYPEIWHFNRNNFDPYLQVYLDVPMDVLAERDQKGLYSGVLLGQASEVVGLDLPVSLPIDSDLVLENADLRELPHNVDVHTDQAGHCVLLA